MSAIDCQYPTSSDLQQRVALHTSIVASTDIANLCKKVALADEDWLKIRLTDGAVLLQCHEECSFYPRWPPSQLYGNDVSPAANLISPATIYWSLHQAYACNKTYSAVPQFCILFARSTRHKAESAKMPLIDVNLSGQLSPTCRLCQRQYHMQRRAMGTFVSAGKGFGKVQEKEALKVWELLSGRLCRSPSCYCLMPR